MFDYHEATKHAAEKIQRSAHFLDWANMPHPFRHYEGVPVLDLPAGAPPQANMIEVLRGAPGRPAAADGAEFLSQLLFHSAAISATKVARPSGYRYALRVNPSSGNLHPTEFHFAAQGMKAWPDGLYHYRVSSHMAEQRAAGSWMPDVLACVDAPWLEQYPLVFVLTTIAWREAWKYRSRAYRYCLHDLGHAWESLALAARACGAEARAVGHFADDDLADLLHLEDEWPLLLVSVRGDAIPHERRWGRRREWLGGTPNRLSGATVEFPLIAQAHAASKLTRPLGRLARPSPRPESAAGDLLLHCAAQSPDSFAEAVRRRRSALDFRGGVEKIGAHQLGVMIEAGMRPHQADFEGDLFGHLSARYIHLYLFVHRVNGIAPGLYRCRTESGTLELLREGDQRVAAAGLSLGQELAGNSCVTFSMIADLERAFGDHGNRGYRYAFFEAGAIGQRFYLAAEAMGFQSTGIGAFYDDEVHRYLGIKPAEGQVVYHFASGYAVADDRLEG